MYVSAFSMRDFSGNGAYCSLSAADDESYVYHAMRDLRYEIRKGPDDGSWILLRIEKTPNGKYSSIPIYMAKADEYKNTVPTFGWTAISFNPSTKSFNVHDSEPQLAVNEIEANESYLMTMWILKQLRLGELDFCSALLCDSISVQKYHEDDSLSFPCEYSLHRLPKKLKIIQKQ